MSQNEFLNNLLDGEDQPNRSTGPITPEGKETSSMNALTDGFRSLKMIVMPGEEAEHQSLCEHLIHAFDPRGETELYFFRHVLHDAWNLERVRSKIYRMAAEGIDPLDNKAVEKDFDRYLRYESRFKSSLRSNIRLLQTVQTSRVYQDLLPGPLAPGVFPPLAVTTQILQLAKRTRKDFPALAINTYASRSNAVQNPADSKPPNKPLQFRDFLTPEERAKY